jgi:uncharacterized protein YjbJ (UPF0337 family)
VIGEDMHSEGDVNRQAGAVRQLAGRMKGDRFLEAKGLAQRAKGSVQKVVASLTHKVAETIDPPTDGTGRSTR